MTLQHPWDYHSGLTEERLVTVARLIDAARSDALARHDEFKGDNGWTLGCSAYQFARHQITIAADEGRYSWLDVLDRSLHFVFQIDGIPVRFYKGDADEAADHTTARTYLELDQMELIFDERDDRRKLLFRFAVETDFDGAAAAIKFVGLDGKRPVLCWEVPYGDRGAGMVVPLDTGRAEGIDLPPPPVRLVWDREDDQGIES
jgi:hypothetical protein